MGNDNTEIIRIEWDAKSVLQGTELLIGRLQTADDAFVRMKRVGREAIETTRALMRDLTQEIKGIGNNVDSLQSKINSVSFAQVTGRLTLVAETATKALLAMQEISKFSGLGDLSNGLYEVERRWLALERQLQGSRREFESGRQRRQGDILSAPIPETQAVPIVSPATQMAFSRLISRFPEGSASRELAPYIIEKMTPEALEHVPEDERRRLIQEVADSAMAIAGSLKKARLIIEQAINGADLQDRIQAANRLIETPPEEMEKLLRGRGGGGTPSTSAPLPNVGQYARMVSEDPNAPPRIVPIPPQPLGGMAGQGLPPNVIQALLGPAAETIQAQAAATVQARAAATQPMAAASSRYLFTPNTQPMGAAPPTMVNPSLINQAAQAQNKYNQALSQTTVQGAKTGGVLGDITSSIKNHIFWIGQSILIWGAFRAVGDFINSLVAKYLELERAIILVASATRESTEAAREQIVAEGTRAAGYGIDPSTTPRVQQLAAQMDVSERTINDARKAYVLFGGDYSNVMQEFIQTERQAQAAGVQSVDILNYLATAQSEVATNAKDSAQSLETYMNALQAALPLAPKLGLGVEELALGLAKLAFTSDVGNAKSAGTFVENFLSRIQNPKTQEALSKMFDIDEPTIAGRAKKVIETYNRLIESGQRDQATRLIELAYGGSLVGAQTKLQAGAVLTGLGEVFDTAGRSLEDADTKVNMIFNSLDTKTRQVASSFEAVVQATSQLDPVLTFFRGLGVLLDSVSTKLLQIATIMQKTGELLEAFKGYNIIGKWREYNMEGTPSYELRNGEVVEKDRESANRSLARGGALSGIPIVGPLMNLLTGDKMDLDFLYWLTQDKGGKASGGGKGLEGGAYPYAPGGGEPLGLDEVTKILGLPEKNTMEDFNRAYAEQLKLLQEIPNYYGDVEDSIIALTDANNNYLETRKVSEEAASNALKQLSEEARSAAEAMQSFGGLRELPEGVTFEQYERGVRKWEDIIRKQIPEKYAGSLLEQKETFFLDNDQYRMLLASAEAMRLAQEELVKIEKSKIQGVFNIPDEGRTLIPFFALQQGFVPRGSVSESDALSQDLANAGSSVTAFAQAVTTATQIISGVHTQSQTRSAYGNKGSGFMHRPADFDRAGYDTSIYENNRSVGGGGAGGGSHVVNDIVVVVDGEPVQRQQNRKQYKELSSARRGAGSGNGGSSKAFIMR